MCRRKLKFISNSTLHWNESTWSINRKSKVFRLYGYSRYSLNSTPRGIRCLWLAGLYDTQQWTGPVRHAHRLPNFKSTAGQAKSSDRRLHPQFQLWPHRIGEIRVRISTGPAHRLVQLGLLSDRQAGHEATDQAVNWRRQAAAVASSAQRLRHFQRRPQSGCWWSRSSHRYRQNKKSSWLPFQKVWAGKFTLVRIQDDHQTHFVPSNLALRRSTCFKQCECWF